MTVTNKTTNLRPGSIIAWQKFAGDSRWYNQTVTFCRRGSIHTISNNGSSNIWTRREINRAKNVKVIKY